MGGLSDVQGHAGGDKPRPYTTPINRVKAGFIPACTKRLIAHVLLLESLNLANSQISTVRRNLGLVSNLSRVGLRTDQGGYGAPPFGRLGGSDLLTPET